MKQFDLEASINFRVSVPERFLIEMRSDCASADASTFQKWVHNEYSDDDDAFVLAILRNGLKHELRRCILDLCKSSGLGGTFPSARVVKA